MSQKALKTSKVKSENTLTRADLADSIYREIGLSRSESASLVDWVLQEISNTLEKGKTAKISGFGSFSCRSKDERVGRNPKTGEEVPITSRRVITFKPSNLLKKLVNENIKKFM